MSKVFFACAMSGLTPYEYTSFQDIFKVMIADSDNDVFCEMLTVHYDAMEEPSVATAKDIKAIEDCDEFVLAHFSTEQSSTLFELGIAYALKKPIKIHCMTRTELPFMVKELDEVSDLVEIIVIKNFKDIRI